MESNYRQVTIRSALAEDIDKLLNLVKAYHEFEGIDLDDGDCRTAINRILDDKSLGVIWFILLGDKVIGYVAICFGFSLEFSGKDAFLDEFFIVPEYRQQGIGTKVLRIVNNEAKKFDIRALHLEVNRNSTRLIHFYKQAGFKARDKYMLMTFVV